MTSLLIILGLVGFVGVTIWWAYHDIDPEE